MSVNDRNLPGVAQGAGVYPGMANPTSSSQPNNPMDNNFATDPTTEERGAGAGAHFEGDKQAKRFFKDTAGVVEGEPGIIESTNVHPLRPDSNDGIPFPAFRTTLNSLADDGWAHAKKSTTDIDK